MKSCQYCFDNELDDPERCRVCMEEQARDKAIEEAMKSTITMEELSTILSGECPVWVHDRIMEKAVEFMEEKVI